MNAYRLYSFRRTILIPACLAAGALVGCGAGSARLTGAADSSSKTLTTIAIAPASPSIAIHATVQLTATATYSDGSTANVTATAAWSSSNSAAASVSSTGIATGMAAGASTITASLDGVSGTVPLTVTATPVSVTGLAIAPASATVAAGATEQFSADATYSNGTTGALATGVTWSSSNASVATVSASGLATAVAAGSAVITAAGDSFTAKATLTVTAAAPTVTAISISPTSATVTPGATEQFTAEAIYSNGTTSTLASGVAWTSSNTAVATINASGLATAAGGGTAAIKAVADGFTATATLTVKTVTAVSVAPGTASIATGGTQQFTATATYSDGSSASVTSAANWTSGNTSFVTVNAAGLATGVSAGSTTVTATLNGISGSAAVTETGGAPSSIAVTPANASFEANSTQQFTATATYSNGTTANVTASATWISSNTSVATIDSSGVATGVASGSTTIAASYDGTRSSVSATVTVAEGSGVNITTWHVDSNRSGLNSNEQTLTPSNVAPATFGKLFSYLVDGYVYGSPLVMSNVTIGGAAHNVLYVATENDSVYAFDADSYGSGAPLWKVSLLNSSLNETPITDGPIQPDEGVTSTPVIDPSTGTLYVVSAQTSSSAGSTFRLNALDIATGLPKFGGPVTIKASVAATNSASVGGVQTLNTSCIQRAALLLANGKIYIGFGGCHSGWLLAYSASTLAQVGVFNASPNLNGEGTYASAGGVWMGGGGPVADSSGNVYITTGNGPWDGQTAFGDSVLKFGPTPVSGKNGTMQPIDYFTPYIYQYMDCDDADLASGGLMLIPGGTTLIAGGKTGTMYLVDSASLGHESANDNGAIQEQVWGEGLSGGDTYQNSCTDSTTNYANITSYEIFGTSAYFNGAVYLGVTPTSSSAPGGVRQFDYSGTLTPDQDSSIYQNQGTRGTSPFISSNGTSDGIVWMIDQGNPLQNTNSAAPTSATLLAYDAANFPTQLYSSATNSGDTPGYGIKFSSPMVVNGKVYISTGHDLTTVTDPQGEIDVYGLR